MARRSVKNKRDVDMDACAQAICDVLNEYDIDTAFSSMGLALSSLISQTENPMRETMMFVSTLIEATRAEIINRAKATRQ